ncbi:MAG: carbohydrate kinase family protein [Ruthenibacterium sp.]
MDIFCIGEILVDFLPGAETGSYVRHAGGAPANVAVAVARNGLKAGFCGKVGDDDFGRFLIEELKANGVVPMCGSPCDHAATTMAFVTLTPEGERSFTFARKPGADMFLDIDDVKNLHFETAKIIHAGSCSLSSEAAREATVYAMRLAHERGQFVSFDVNYRDAMWNSDRKEAQKWIKQVLPLVDFLKVSQEESCLVEDGNDLAILEQEYQIVCTVETLGAQGANAYYKDKKIFCPPVPANCIDATGAGDAFWGGFLSALLFQGLQCGGQPSEEMLYQAMAYASAAGSLAVRKKGAIPALPFKNEVMDILNVSSEKDKCKK